MADTLASVMRIRPPLRSALALAERGWHVFPCVPGGKRPALRGSWHEHATTEPVRIRAWWSQAAYNIGIACGTLRPGRHRPGRPARHRGNLLR